MIQKEATRISRYEHKLDRWARLILFFVLTSLIMRGLVAAAFEGSCELRALALLVVESTSCRVRSVAVVKLGVAIVNDAVNLIVIRKSQNSL